MECRTKAMNEIRSELELHKREVHQLRIRNSDLTERIRSQRCEECLIMQQPQVAIKFPMTIDKPIAAMMPKSAETMSSSDRYKLLPKLTLTAISMPITMPKKAPAEQERKNANSSGCLEGNVAKSEASSASSLSSLCAGSVKIHGTEGQRPITTSTSLVGNGLRLLFDRMRS